jgi:hypothetical protein
VVLDRTPVILMAENKPMNNENAYNRSHLYEYLKKYKKYRSWN